MNFGNWYRPTSSLALQAAMGVQYVIGAELESRYTRDQYKAACRALGLYYILQAPPDDATLVAEAADPYCIGWDQKDEPNDASPTLTPIADLQANYAKWKKAAPNKLVMINYDGGQQWSGFDYAAGTKCADLVMLDFYVRNDGGPTLDIKTTMRPVLDRFKAYLQPGQKFGFFMETGDQDLQKQSWNKVGVGPSPKDLQDYFDIATEYKVDTVAFFEDVIGAWFEAFTGTPTTNLAVISQNADRLKTPIAGLLGTAPPIVVTPPTTAPAGVTITLPSGEVLMLPSGKSYKLTAN